MELKGTIYLKSALLFAIKYLFDISYGAVSRKHINIAQGVSLWYAVESRMFLSFKNY